MRLRKASKERKTSCRMLELKEKNSERPLWPFYSDLSWGPGWAGEPSNCSGSRRRVKSPISNFTGWLRKQDAGTATAAPQWGVAHKMRCFGVYSRWLSNSQRSLSHFFLDGSLTPDMFALCDTIFLNGLGHRSLNHGWPPDFSWTTQILLPGYSELALRDKLLVFPGSWNRKMWTQGTLG